MIHRNVYFLKILTLFVAREIGPGVMDQENWQFPLDRYIACRPLSCK